MKNILVFRLIKKGRILVVLERIKSLHNFVTFGDTNGRTIVTLANEITCVNQRTCDEQTDH